MWKTTNTDRRKSETRISAVFFCVFWEKDICSHLALLQSKEGKDKCQNEKSKSSLEKREENKLADLTFEEREYSCAVKPQFREIGNRLTGTVETA